MVGVWKTGRGKCHISAYFWFLSLQDNLAFLGVGGGQQQLQGSSRRAQPRRGRKGKQEQLLQQKKLNLPHVVVRLGPLLLHLQGLFYSKIEPYGDCCYVLDLLGVKGCWKDDSNKCLSPRHLSSPFKNLSYVTFIWPLFFGFVLVFRGT